MEFDYIFRIIESVAACGVGVVGFFMKNQLTNIQKSISQNSEDIRRQTRKINERIDKVEEKAKEDVEKVAKELHDLKEDLPLIYTLREDFIRTMNGVETSMGKIDNKIDKLLSKQILKD